ncbi:hypothetical protein ABOM_009289 [Aspergillus bombycis]|uniref:Mediator complex subunit 15 KIX domain-containing protein n=1 Tax=Aspergillus bombycis TaxID=109264 RepID=A0A1F7ZVE9_9EURO|nr:hypothetical protein ABOM_009289 [Aspergillus bombycis]OGM43038.1 hypothetical protein ABOM_009289 [Aspergillus bombycis]
MNAANFPNAGGGMPGGGNPHGQMQVPQQKPENQMMVNYLAQALQSQGSFTGWRADVPLKERAVNVHQMCTSLRLIQPHASLQSLAQAALSFEQKAFNNAKEKVDYDKECNDKLVHIQETRARQAAVLQQNGGMMAQSGHAAGMAGVGQAFPQQMGRPAQASPMPGQQQMAMGMNDPSRQAAIQHRQQQQQQQSQAILQQRAQPRPGNGIPLTDDLSTLSAQEYEHVCRIANQILSKTSQEDVDKIKMNLQNMTHEQRQYLNRKNMDPITYFFRSQALTQLRRHKRSRQEAQQRAQNTGVDPNSAMMGDPMMNAQQRQMFQNMMNLQRNSFSMGSQPNLDPSSFIGNVENIQGQQADGLRSQEAGQLVVPASSSQMNQQPFTTPQNMFQVGQGNQTNMNGAGISPQFFSQQQLQTSQNLQQDRTQQAPQFQPQSQAQTQAQARAQAAQKAQMAISQAGQANSQMQQQMTQQSPAMPMLNRPMAPGQISPAQVAAQVRPPSRAPGQQPAGVQPLGGQTGMQGRPQIPPNLPPMVQEQLARMTQEQLTAFLMNQQRRPLNNQAMARANANQQSMPMQPNLSQPGQGQQMVNGQAGNNQNMRASLNLQQQLANMSGAQAPNQMLPGQQQMTAQQRQQQQQQRQHDLYKMQLLRQQSGGLEMSPDQVKDMDRMPFPPSIHNNLPSPPPKHIKTWGQLKQWATANPQVLGGIDLQKLVAFQKLHLNHILAQNKEGGRNPDSGGQNPWMQMPFQGQPQQFMNQQQFQPGQQQGPINMPPMRPITGQDIQIARQRLGAQVQNYTDEQLRELLYRNRQKQLMQLAQNRAAQLAAQQGQQTPSSQQPPVTAPSATPQIKSEAQHQQPTTQLNQQMQATKTQNATPGKGVKGPAAKQPPKRKIPNEESADAQNTPAQKLAPPVASQGLSGSTPARPNMPFTREQLVNMTPQQRAQLEAHIRRQQGQNQTRAPISRTAAEEQWNNLPDKIRQMYNEILVQAPPAEPVSVTPEQNAQMSQQLRECTDMLGRMDTLVQWFSKIPNQEKNVKSLLAMRIQLMRQFKPGPDWTINDHFTVSPEYLTMTTNYVKKLFQAMITRVSQHQNQPSGQRPSVSQGSTNVQSSTQNNMPALNASNLQQLQQQEEAIQRARRASSQTAVSATSAVPPAPMPPQELKLPPPKKRKQSHAGPITGTAGTKSPAAKQTAADAKMVATAMVGPFKCSVPQCQHHYQGFATQNALDKHVEETHRVEESIEDPLQFALDSFRNLVKEEDKASPESQAPKKSAGSAMDTPQVPPKVGVPSPPMKQEAGTTPITAGATPVARVFSQFGAKPTSPASNQTPRGPSAKVPSSTAKPSYSKDGKKEAGKTTEQMPSLEPTIEDPWTSSAVSLEAIQDTFMDFGDDSGFGFGPMDEFINADMFANTQSKDTPDSVETAIVTQTPKDNDLPKVGDLASKGAEGLEGNWIPMDWINLPGRFEDGPLLNESWEDIDWDTLDRSNMNVDDSGIAICAM